MSILQKSNQLELRIGYGRLVRLLEPISANFILRRLSSSGQKPHIRSETC
jgi:hypothetical protein